MTGRPWRHWFIVRICVSRKKGFRARRRARLMLPFAIWIHDHRLSLGSRNSFVFKPLATFLPCLSQHLNEYLLINILKNIIKTHYLAFNIKINLSYLLKKNKKNKILMYVVPSPRTTWNHQPENIQKCITEIYITYSYSSIT